MTKQLLRPALFLMMTLILMWSCQEPLESQLDTDLSLTEAQSFYEQIQEQAKALSQNNKANKRNQKTSRQAFWDKQEKYKAGNQELISIPILFDDDLNTPGYGFKKMVFYKDTRNGKTNARIIEYIFDKAYLAKNFGNLSMKTFTGMMIVYDADGNYLDGTAVQNGKPTSKVTVALDGEIMKAKNANGRESATSSCVVSFITSGCSGGSSAIGGANQSGSGDAELLSALKNCASVYIYSLSCDSQGETGSQPSLGFPYPLPGLVGPNPFDTFSGFAGGGNTGGGYVYMGPNTGASVMQNVGTNLVLDFISQNSSWLSSEEIKLIEAYPDLMSIMTQYQFPEAGRPNLGWVGNAILSNSGSEYSKDLFQYYWLGVGSPYVLTKSRFDDIVNVAKSCPVSSVSSTIFLGQQATANTTSFYGSEEYKYTIGTATVYYKLVGNAIGFYDLYDFDPKEFGTRSKKAELITRALYVVSPKVAKSFTIKYP